jgi:hypothetical protein
MTWYRDADTDDSGRVERHGPIPEMTCSTCHESDDPDALRVVGGRFVHPSCEAESSGSDDANRIPPSVADAQEGER